MVTNFDNTIFTAEMLKHEWLRCTERIEALLYAGWTLKEIWNLSNYIYESSFAFILYPGTSMGKLLISKPIDGKLNYNQTLSIIPDVESNKIYIKYYKYKDNNILEKEILWRKECLENNLINRFNEFMNWNSDWK